MNETKTSAKPLDLVIDEIESLAKPGCNSSSTNRLCTCPVAPTNTASLFTGKTAS
jgi:hypothetical protein